MALIVNDFAKRVTVFAVDESLIYFDIHGQTARLYVDPNPIESMCALYQVHRRQLRECMAKVRESQFENPDSTKFKEIKSSLEDMIYHLVECTYSLPGKDNPHDELGRRTLSWCIYERMHHYILAQNSDGNGVFLIEEFQPDTAPASASASSAITTIPDLPTFDSRQVQIELHEVNHANVFGTVILNAGGREDTPMKRYTCVSLREAGHASMRGGNDAVRDMASTLAVLSRVKQLRVRLQVGFGSMDRLCVPHLVGYISHAACNPDGGPGPTYIVGAVVELLDSPSAMITRLRAEQATPLPPALAASWADSLRETFKILHSQGMAWGGAAVEEDSEAKGECLATCVEIIGDRPWLLRGYSVQGAEGKKSDLEALKRLSELLPRRRRRLSLNFLKRYMPGRRQ